MNASHAETPGSGGPLHRSSFRVHRSSFLRRGGRGFVLPVTPLVGAVRMHLMPPTEKRTGAVNDVETIDLSRRHLDFLARLARQTHPGMPAAFGLPHVIRAILDRAEQSGVDLTEASSEADVTRLAAMRLGGNSASSRGKAGGPSATTFASSSRARRVDPSTLPGRDRVPPARRPRSGRG
jgi:hypothetical protein